MKLRVIHINALTREIVETEVDDEGNSTSAKSTVDGIWGAVTFLEIPEEA